jgi:hypothetical protein
MVQAQDEMQDTYVEPDSMYAVQRAVKIDPLQVFFGDLQLYYEHMVGEKWSIELGLGPTRRNFTASIFQYELDDFGSNVDVKTRYAMSLGIKRYFWDTGELYGPYLEAAVMHRRHDKTYNVIDLNGQLTERFFDDSRRYTSLMLIAGFQAIPLQSNLFCDFYLGAGLRYRDFEVVRSTGINEPELYTVSHEQTWVGALQFGVKVGYGF